MFLRIASGLMALLFAASAALQYNDPDPARWMAIYGAAFAASALAAFGRLGWPFAATVFLAAAGFAAFWFPQVPWRHEQLLRVEEAREFFGLTLVAGWMLVVGIAARVRAGKVQAMRAKLTRR